MGRKWATKQDYLCYNGSELKNHVAQKEKIIIKYWTIELLWLVNYDRPFPKQTN